MQMYRCKVVEAKQQFHDAITVIINSAAELIEFYGSEWQ